MPGDKIKHGRSKHISNYGGVGSIIETTDNSIIIETFDNWGYAELNEKLSRYVIHDDRLLQRLKNRFPNLQHLVAIPTDIDSKVHQVRPQANYFPKWLYCTYCHRFATYDEWWRRWKSANKKLEFFNPPKCSNKDCKESHLEQVRFVMTCNNGHIHDLPWEFWNKRLPTDSLNDEDDEKVNEEKLSGPQLDFSQKCCEEQDLVYKISRDNTELSGIWIECIKCNLRANLKGVFNFEQKCAGKKYWLKPINGVFYEEECNEITKVKLKTSNSVYYANTLSSLYIPEFQINLSFEHRGRVDRLKSKGKTNAEIVERLYEDDDVPKELTTAYLENGSSGFIPENIYRQVEYEYFLQKEQPESKQIRFRVIDCFEQINGFSQLIQIDKLKRTTVQTSFTRNEPIDIDSILLKEDDNGYEYAVQRQSVSKNNFETKTLPAVESYGEGILFVLDKDQLEKWEVQTLVIERAKKIISNARFADWKSHQMVAKTLTPRKILIHTLSHLLMREFEYVCGYPASSLQERLFVSETMRGFLISAFDGTDGYLGGLSTLCDDLINLNKIVNSAVFRATDCSSDPICIESDGQGVGQLNLAACHSCTLTPEMACELSNLYLDRKLVVDTEFGFFHALIN